MLGASRSQLVSPDATGRLVYKPTTTGDTILDFSNCGYAGGGVKILDVPVKATLQPAATGDDTARIQQAIDAVAKQAPGAVLLAHGRYRVGGQLKIAASGVVLRGEGNSESGTVLIATGKSVRHLIDVGGTTRIAESSREKTAITDDRVPVGARSFQVRDASGLRAGDTVFVSRIGNQEWIHFIGMDQIKPVKGERDLTQWSAFALKFDRVIAAVSGNRITLDAPLACAVEARWGGGEVWKYRDTRIEQVGVENLYAISEFDPRKTERQGNRPYHSDEEHASGIIDFGKVKNAWARNLTAVHFCHGVVQFGGESKWITVQDCRALDPVSQITGGRRYPYSIGGQLLLVQRCYSRGERHAFAVGARVCGPNVFLDCFSEQDYACSEPHHRWSVGGLYDNVQGQISFADRGAMGSGHGWAGANYVAWNCRGSLTCEQPPTAQNYAIGFVGKKREGPFKRKDGFWESHGQHVEPRSLYLKQLEERLGIGALKNIGAPVGTVVSRPRSS